MTGRLQVVEERLLFGGEEREGERTGCESDFNGRFHRLVTRTAALLANCSRDGPWNVTNREANDAKAVICAVKSRKASSTVSIPRYATKESRGDANEFAPFMFKLFDSQLNRYRKARLNLFAMAPLAAFWQFGVALRQRSTLPKSLRTAKTVQ